MQREATAHPGRMLAVRASEAQVHECLQLGRTAGSVALAAHNSPSDWTLSGDQQALAVIASRAATTRLPVSGAWHSPAMAGAVDDVCAAARACGQRPVHAQVVVNRTGALAGIDADVAELLAGQLVRPVQWAATMQTLAGAGVTRWLIAGPGTMLRGLLYKNLGRVAHVAIVETFADARALAK
jgi:[acyl-carrier-protein] S-malonyltransferase